MQIHLQQIGKRNAVYAKDLVVGDIIICNFGDTEKVLSLKYTKSGKMINYEILCNNKIYLRRTTPTRLFAVERVNK